MSYSKNLLLALNKGALREAKKRELKIDIISNIQKDIYSAQRIVNNTDISRNYSVKKMIALKNNLEHMKKELENIKKSLI